MNDKLSKSKDLHLVEQSPFQTGENGSSVDQLGNILVQLTAALRNLADTNSSRDRILNCRLLESLTTSSDFYDADPEIILNVSRIFRCVMIVDIICVLILL